jgi:hypothetical protein
MWLDLIVLPAEICGKVEGFGEERSVTTSKPKPEGFDANSLGPSGFRAAGAHFVGSLGRTAGTTFASLRVDRLADRETELIQSSHMLLYFTLSIIMR